MREFAHIDPDGNLLLFGSRQGTTAQQEFDQRVFEFATAINRGDVERVREFLAQDRTLATSLINSRWPLHLFADAPGHRPNAVAMVAALVEAGAELDAQAVDMWHEETALHWAASNDDVELIDALLDAGADIEHPGSSIGGGPPSQSALGYGQWAALRRLSERGAKLTLAQAAALGLLPLVRELAGSNVEDLSVAFWNACRGGQLPAAQLLIERGADVNWVAPWSGETPLDAARHENRDEVVAWLSGSRG
jgi:ankyrin repeat protein